MPDFDLPTFEAPGHSVLTFANGLQLGATPQLKRHNPECMTILEMSTNYDHPDGRRNDSQMSMMTILQM